MLSVKTLSPSLHIVILAAGAGTRMRSKKPKVLHALMGKPMLQHVIDVSKKIHPKKIWMLYGHEGEQIRSAIQDADIEWIEQNPRLGSGHALQILYPSLEKQATPQDKILIISADSPGLSVHTLQKMLVEAEHSQLVLLNIVLKDPSGFGHILRDTQDHITGIVEYKDATEAQKKIQEIYSGVMLVHFEVLKDCLFQLSEHNAQQEYYLTQLVDICHTQKKLISSVVMKDSFEAKGINDRVQLAEMERYMQHEKAKALMLQGVTIMDPARFDVRGNLKAAQDVTIDINCIFEGEVSIGSGSMIGAHCILKNCHLGKNVMIHPFTLIDGATIADNAIIGPFARLRPETTVGEHAHIGNFVEVKKSHIGKGSKANHLSYIGDATLGEEVNIGAGTITCNYDGANKCQTIIESGAFIGSNASLVAPIRIGKDATIGAGSVINRDAPANQLTVARARQTVIPGWKRKEKA